MRFLSELLSVCVLFFTSIILVHGQNIVWEDFVSKYGEGFYVHWNENTQMPQKIYGRGIILKRGHFDTQEELLDSVYNFITGNNNVFKVDMTHLVLQTCEYWQQKWLILYTQIYENIPVLETQVSCTIDDSVLTVFGCDYHPDINLSVTPLISQDEAEQIAVESTNFPNGANITEIELCILPQVANSELFYHLCWKVKVAAIEYPDGRGLIIDANNGQLVRDFQIAFDGNFTIDGFFYGKIRPVHTWDAKISQPFKYEYCHVQCEPGHVIGTNSNEAGYYHITGYSTIGTNALYVRAAGEYSKLYTNYKPWYDPLHHHTFAIDPHTHNFPASGHTTYYYTWDDVELKEEAINAYYHITKIGTIMSNQSPWNYPIMRHITHTIASDLGTENGKFYGEDSIMFGHSGGYRWALSSDINYHEYGHHAIWHVYGGQGIGWTNPTDQSRAMNEGFADYFVATFNNDHVIGEDVGVNRDLDNSLIYPDDMGGGRWHDGQIIGGAVWDLRTYLNQFDGDRLFFRALRTFPQAHDFFAYLENVLIVDDDNANLSDGTPHDPEILHAFQNHGITIDWFLPHPFNLHTTLVMEDKIHIIWDRIGYDEQGFIVKRWTSETGWQESPPVPATQLWYSDEGLQPGKTYKYQVVAYKGSLRSGPSNTITVQTLFVNAPTNLYINPVVFSGDSLYWNDNSAVEDGFKIERKIGSGSYAVIHTTGSNVTKWFDPNIQLNYEHHYRIKAFTSSYDSDTSNSVVFTPPGIFSDTIKAIDYYHGSRSLFRDNNGHYHLVLKHHNRLWYTKSTDNGATWSLARNLAWIGPEIPSVVATSAGLPCLVWQERSGIAPNFIYDLVYAYFDGSGNVHKTTLVDNADHDLSPAMAITADDHIYIAFVRTYAQNSAGKIAALRFYHNNPQQYPNSVIYEFTDCDHAGNIRIVRDDQNNLHLVWREDYTVWGGNPSHAAQVGQIYHGLVIGTTGTRESVATGWINSSNLTYNVSSPEIVAMSSQNLNCAWGLRRTYPDPNITEVFYRAKISGDWQSQKNCTEDPALGDYPGLARIIRNTVFCLANNKIFVTYPNYPSNSRVLVENVNNYDAIQAPSGPILGNAAIIYSKNTSIANFYKIGFTIKAIPLPPFNQQVVYSLPPGPPPEFTAYNNAQRLLKDANGNIHLSFTSGDNIYHTYHNANDTIWSEPAFLGEGKYPALALGADGKLYCAWCYHGYQEFNGVPYYVEYLRMRSFNGVSWSKPTKLLFHTYGTYLWGVGAPSLAINDSMAYVTFKSYHGPTFNPTPGEPYPHIVVVEGPALIYGSFPLNNPDAYTCQIIDTIIKTPNPVDTLTYRDSLVPLLISPSITVDLAGIPHILWEGDSTAMRYYTITDSVISRQLFDINTSNNVDFPTLAANGDQVQLLWTARDSVRYRFGWTNTENLSQPITIAACENPIASGPYLAWTKQDGYLSHLYYGAIPASGLIDPVEINYSTDLISYPQILFNPEKQNQTPSLDLIWTEYNQIDSLGYVYYLNLPLTEEIPVYSFDMGTETPVPILVQRDGFLTYGSEDFKTIDYDSTELIYHLTLHSPHKKYKIKWSYYHQEPDKIKLDFSIDDILHHNRWVDPNEQVTQEAWIPDSCLQDNEITIKVKKLSGTLAVLSGFEICERLVGGGGPQGSEVMISRPFFLERIYPNPAKGMIRIRFNSPDERRVMIRVYDVVGRVAEQLFDGKAKAGMNEVLLMPQGLPAGVYFIRVETEGYKKVEKAILLR